jgi:hypothetical protein
MFRVMPLTDSDCAAEGAGRLYPSYTINRKKRKHQGKSAFSVYRAQLRNRAHIRGKSEVLVG